MQAWHDGMNNTVGLAVCTDNGDPSNLYSAFAQPNKPIKLTVVIGARLVTPEYRKSIKMVLLRKEKGPDI